MNTAYVKLSSSIPGYLNVRVTIPEHTALDPFDIGATELIAIRPDRALFELRAYRQMGYGLKFNKRH